MDRLLASPHSASAGAGTGSTSPATPRRSGKDGELHLPARLALPRLRHRRVQRRQAVRPVRPGADRRRPAAGGDDKQKAEQLDRHRLPGHRPEGCTTNAIRRSSRWTWSTSRSTSLRRRSWADGRLRPLPRSQVRPDPARRTTTPSPASSAAPRRCYGTVRRHPEPAPQPAGGLPPDARPPVGRRAADRGAARPRSRSRLEESRASTSPQKGASKAVRHAAGRRLRVQIAKLESQLDSYEADGTPKLLAMGVREQARAERTARSTSAASWTSRARRCRAASSQVLTHPKHAERRSAPHGEAAAGSSWPSGSPRRDNPLTARVMANRVWLHLFGRGLVATPDNFGAAGQPPSHPELLDHLAVSLHGERLVGQEADPPARAEPGLPAQLAVRSPRNDEIDPDNVLVWRMAPPARRRGAARRHAGRQRQARPDAAGGSPSPGPAKGNAASRFGGRRDRQIRPPDRTARSTCRSSATSCPRR